MPFTTIDFIVFFAVVFFGYHLLPHRFRWLLLLVASWVFYGWMSPYYLIFLAFATAVTYVAAIGMDCSFRREKAWISMRGQSVGREEKRSYREGMDRRRWWMSCVAIVLLVSVLMVFKYLEFLLSNVAWLGGVVGLGWRVPKVDLILPIGLSFYMFQGMAYVIDVQRGVVEAERHFFRHALFVSYFPQLLQGPIGNYGRLAHQFFEAHPFDYERVVLGLQRVAWGFFKKVMIANVIADRINPAWADVGEYFGPLCWTVVLFLYAIQLYADFSGYMDIACGCSQMLGIRLDENFNCPYFSRTVSEFWRRWHMSLSSWFKDYLFYPVLRADWCMKLRKCFAGRYLATVVPTSFALAIVWATTGLWHGASWGYVAWGVYYGFFMVLAVCLAPAYEKFHARFPELVASKPYVGFQMVRTFIIVLVGYSIFKPADLSATYAIWRQMVNVERAMPLAKCIVAFTTVPMLLSMLVLLIVDVFLYRLGGEAIGAWSRRIPKSIRWFAYVVVLWVMIYFGLYGEGFENFEYFKF